MLWSASVLRWILFTFLLCAHTHVGKSHGTLTWEDKINKMTEDFDGQNLLELTASASYKEYHVLLKQKEHVDKMTLRGDDPAQIAAMQRKLDKHYYDLYKKYLPWRRLDPP